MGVICFNVIDTWLNVKTCDGALETRGLVNGKITEVCFDDALQEYSVEDGGNTTTMIICISNKVINDEFIYNGTNKNYDQLFKPMFFNAKELNKQRFISDYTTMNGYRTSNKSSKDKNDNFNNSIFINAGGTEYWLVCKRIIGCRSKGSIFKLIKANNITNYIENNLSSEIKYCKVSYKIGLWLLGYLNSKDGIEELKNTFRHGKTNGNKKENDWLLVAASGTFKTCRVPDIDYYKTNHLEKFNTYITWIEENMNDKDKFLAGIDESLIKG